MATRFVREECESQRILSLTVPWYEYVRCCRHMWKCKCRQVRLDASTDHAVVPGPRYETLLACIAQTSTT